MALHLLRENNGGRMKKLCLTLLAILSLNSFALEFDYTVSPNLTGKLRENTLAAIKLVQKTLASEEYWQKVYAVDSFTCVEADTPSISEIRNMKVQFHLESYWYFRRGVLAKTVGSTVSINRRAGSRNPKPLANTIFHELLHVAGISHCGVNNRRKYPHINQSIPYVLGDLLEQSL